MFKMLPKKKSNLIASLTKDNGDLLYSHKEICDVTISYFNNLFQQKNICNDFLPIINKILISISSYDNDSLLSPFTIDEFKVALFQMNYDKSPGPNDLNPTFYNFFWHMCGEGIFQKTTTWLETRTFPSQFNNTSMKDFRPISLCNALYKITSKFLTNRLKT